MRRKFIGERMPVGSRGVTRQAIVMVQTTKNRRRDHLCVFRKAMTGGHELIRFGQRMWNARSQAMRRMSCRSLGIGGRPGRDVHHQNSRQP